MREEVQIPVRDDSDPPDAVAASALELVPEMADHPLDPDQLRLGDAFHSCFLREDEVVNSVTALDVRALLSKGRVVTYPVRQGDQIVSSITLTHKPEGGWRIDSIGSANQVRAIVEVRDHHTVATGRRASDYFVVSIPALKVVLVATEGRDGVMVSTVFDNLTLGLHAGVWRPADEVLEAAARIINRRSSNHGEDNDG